MYTRLPVWSIVLHTSDAVSTATAVGRLRLGLSSSLAGHSTILRSMLPITHRVVAQDWSSMYTLYTDSKADSWLG